ncbi:hypothetical protein Acr_11g0008930 [Actinidia rufa]|uniref:Uncharacterized protein n=1 Tax=Actinidia rufa TaxID=165716 RepID=A0A7J0FFC1_9ERIC|nr:hypothetical protein Acr_11g0008930 [Actinidia rufa]
MASSMEMSLARFHGLVLPRSRGFGGRVWRSKCGDGTS